MVHRAGSRRPRPLRLVRATQRRRRALEAVRNRLANRIVIDGVTYVHYYDNLTDVACGIVD